MDVKGLLISEDEGFLVFLSFHSDCSVFRPSNNCAEDTAVAGKMKENQKSSPVSMEKVGKVKKGFVQLKRDPVPVTWPSVRLTG